MSTLLKNKKSVKLNIQQLKAFALTQQQCRSLKGGDDGIIVQDVIVH